MADVVVTVPMRLWAEWLAEGCLPGEEWDGKTEYHFWIPQSECPHMTGLSTMSPGDRVYIVAHGKLRGYAPIVRIERVCKLRPGRSCLVRRAGAVAVTVAEPIRGFQGWRYRWWEREDEMLLPEWETP